MVRLSGSASALGFGFESMGTDSEASQLSSSIQALELVRSNFSLRIAQC